MTASPRKAPRRPAAVVAVGASAGGLESLGRLLAGLPRQFPAPILAVLHLDPDHESMAVELLRRRTPLKVVSARGGIALRRGTVYLAPPDRHLLVRGGRLHLSRAARVNHSRPSIDVLFSSVAAAFGAGAVGIVLSGAGRDGADGLADIKARGGQAITEDASTARFPSMPEAAAKAGSVDAVLPVGQIPAFLARAVGRKMRVSERQWLRMLGLLQAATGTRFSRYRSSTLQRRLQYRLAATGCRSMAAYLALLEDDEGEAKALKAAFLIKVSSFRRDPAAWKALDAELGRRAPGPHGLRAWSAGCATGEEAYSLALLLARRHGTGPGVRWKVFGTDLDEAALATARAGRYTQAQVAALPTADLRRGFVREGTGWRVRKPVRDRVVFGRHDLLHDPPLPSMDVLACRNVLIYFQPEEKERALARLGSAVVPGGLLFLGQSEGARTVAGFDRIGRTTLFRRSPLPTAMTTSRKASRPAAGQAGAAALAASLQGSSTLVALAIDRHGDVRSWNRAAELFFGRGAPQALGKPLAKAVGADAARRLRAASAAPADAGEPVAIERDTADGPSRRDFECLPAAPPLATLFLGVPAPGGASPRPRTSGADVRPPRHRNAESRMQAQQSLNEELQSRNEELETVNEELQSLNDELSTMEEQMRGMAEESRLNGEFLRLLLDTSSDALIACDADDRVAFWSRSAVSRYRLSSAQAVGGDLFELVPALAVPALRAAARKVRQPNRDGRVAVKHDGLSYVFEPLMAGSGKGRGYLLRVRAGTP